jgi:phosphoribosylaminoimidazolecarboxamide formyltransferase/IMP cyclohydrolase
VLAELKAHGKPATRPASPLGGRLQPHRPVRRAISNYLSALQDDGSKAEYPAQMNATFVKVQDLRYGENPHQSAAFYRDLHPAPARWSRPSSCRARS